MTAAAVALAVVQNIGLTKRTFFLPPKFGWKPHALGAGYMREVEQYFIEVDELPYRYDAIGRDIWGTEHQFHIRLAHRDPDFARRAIGSRFESDGLAALPVGAARDFKLSLPATVYGRYV